GLVHVLLQWAAVAEVAVGIAHGRVPYCRSRILSRRLPHARGEELERLACEHVHVRLAIVAAGLDDRRRLDRAGDRHAGVAGRVAIAVARRAARAGLGDTPGGARLLAHALREKPREGFARRADS